ncbi:hypothetical protein ATE84_2861 [Aquimarina sp. MAR_2010_214]|uniref:hypothetical protein n=1 Tax=Aquimarina sp. MAR_2010_214 TaxID=1250026 RepID=UPI000CAB8F49|nr:hypothetical protein [Aquimarina sp. MAR_2010_214]PKV50794.1 hypothetical protein ATE84_2861 [Aquimarina sp. MAR_2010_214]
MSDKKVNIKKTNTKEDISLNISKAESKVPDFEHTPDPPPKKKTNSKKDKGNN